MVIHKKIIIIHYFKLLVFLLIFDEFNRFETPLKMQVITTNTNDEDITFF